MLPVQDVPLHQEKHRRPVEAPVRPVVDAKGQERADAQHRAVSVLALVAGLINSISHNDSDTTVKCWGIGTWGGNGSAHTGDLGDDEVPADIPYVDIGGRALQLSAGGGHVCALLADSSLRCWGSNAYGQLGYGHTNHVGDDETPASAGPVPYD